MTEEEFHAALAEIYRNLLERQQPLGREFEEVWEANLEELYEE